MVLRASKRHKPEDAKIRQRHLTTLGGYFAREMLRLKRPVWLSAFTGIAVAFLWAAALWGVCRILGWNDVPNLIVVALIAGLVTYADMRRPL